MTRLHTLEELMAVSIAAPRFRTTLLTVFAVTGLTLAAIGIYGLMAYSVEQRTQEIGIRLALGAETSRVRRMVVLQGMSLAAIGVVVGVASALGLTRFMANLLFGVQARDPVVFVGIPLAWGVWITLKNAARMF